MVYILFFLGSFLLIYLFYLIFVINKEKALNRMKKSKDVLILSKIGNIDIEKVNFKRLARLLSITNSFIIAIIATVILVIDRFISSFYLWILVTFFTSIVLLIPMIFVFYKLIGKKLMRKEDRNV